MASDAGAGNRGGVSAVRGETSPPSPLDRRAAQAVAAARAWGRRHSRVILAVAAAAFVVGMALSVRQLGLDRESVRLGPLLLALALGGPASVAAKALELQLCARAVARRVGFVDAVVVTSAATVANLLPVPASLAVRGGALVNAGAGLRETGVVLLLAGLMWLGMAIAVTGAAAGGLAGGVAAALGGVAALVVAAMIARRGGAAVAGGFVAVRAALLGTLILRLWLCFAAIGAPLPAAEAAYYAVAGVIGNLAMIVPAGLGVSEGAAALMAQAAGGSAAAAFLALGLNRLLGLLLCGVIATLGMIRPR